MWSKKEIKDNGKLVKQLEHFSLYYSDTHTAFCILSNDNLGDEVESSRPDKSTAIIELYRLNRVFSQIDFYNYKLKLLNTELNSINVELIEDDILFDWINDNYKNNNFPKAVKLTTDFILNIATEWNKLNEKHPSPDTGELTKWG